MRGEEIFDVILRDLFEFVILRVRLCLERQRKTESYKENNFLHVLSLSLRLDCKPKGRFGLSGDFSLILQISWAFVKRSDDRQLNCRSEHYPNEEHEVTSSLQLHRAIWILTEEMD